MVISLVHYVVMVHMFIYDDPAPTCPPDSVIFGIDSWSICVYMDYPANICHAAFSAPISFLVYLGTDVSSVHLLLGLKTIIRFVKRINVI